MKYRIKRISPLQAGKVLAAIYALFGIALIPFLFLTDAFGSVGSGGLSIIKIPAIYILGAFVGGIVGSFVYNLVAARIGGIEIDFDEDA